MVPSPYIAASDISALDMLGPGLAVRRMIIVRMLH